MRTAGTTICRALLALTLVASSLVAAAAPADALVRVQLTSAEQAHLDLLNDYRRERGLPAVQIDASAQRDARQWTAHLAASGALDHSTTVGGECDRAGDCRGWAENVGYASSNERVFELFEASEGHASNMTMTSDGAPVVVGIGVLRVGDRVYATQRLYRCGCDNDDLAQRLNADRAAHLAYARALHQDLLHRPGSDAEIEAVAAPLAYGVDRRAAAESLVYSDAWVGAIVVSLYRSTLGRDPDDHGRAHWIGMIVAGTPTSNVAAHFYGSGEYVQRTGGTVRGWVDDLYRQLQGRAATGAELDHWSAAISGGTSPVTVAEAVYMAHDARRRRVQAVYQELLGRDPEPGGWDHWTAQLADGRDVRLTLELVSSPEYASRAAARFR